MNFDLTDEQKQIQAMAEGFSRDHLAPHAQDWDKNQFFPVKTIRQSAALGFGGLFVDEAYGGCGLSRLEGSLIFEALSKGCVSTSAYLSIHNMVGGLINTFGDDAQKSHWLPHLSSLKYLSSYCLTEPGSGSDAASLKMIAERVGDHYVLNGSKAFISGAGVSDVYLVMARTGGGGPHGISAFLVDKNTTGLTFGKHEEKLGWRSQPTCMVHFDNCEVPGEHRVGQEGMGFIIAMTGLDGGRINVASCSLGGAQHCLDLAKAHITQRKQFGKTLSHFQALQFKIADMETELSAARLMVHRAAHAFSAKDPDATLYCAMAKRFATDVGFKVVNEALQLHGGYGYIADYQIERYLRDLRVHQILEGTNEIMRLIISRKVLKN